MSVAERTTYVCDNCEREDDEDSVVGDDTWIYVRSLNKHFCGECWDTV